MNADAKLSQMIMLHDGRVLGYAEAGEADGVPVIYCHGFPASRLESRLVAAAALRQGAFLLAPDRPGYGLSRWKAMRDIAAWVEDAAEFADALQLQRFSVLGVSGGGPYALALAQRLPERVEAVAVVCGLGPVYRAEAMRSMHGPARLAFGTAHDAPWLNRLIFGGLLGRLMFYQPLVALTLLTVGMREADRRTLVRPEVRSVVCASLREGLRRGPRGALQDMVLYSQAWGFDFAEIAMPITFWHGDADVTVPVTHTQMLARGVPAADVRIVPREGHFSLPIDRADEILATLLNARSALRNKGAVASQSVA